jgi:hypothetical protein
MTEIHKPDLNMVIILLPLRGADGRIGSAEDGRIAGWRYTNQPVEGRRE